tara:strand:+ start:704 stop:1030 length:327 start_codon:yes stop_codon:yes gene_type:complete
MKNDIKNTTETSILDIEEFSYLGHYEAVTNIVLEWRERATHKKTLSNELNTVADSLYRIGVYVSLMQERQRTIDSYTSKLRRAKLEAEANLLVLQTEIKDKNLDICLE